MTFRDTSESVPMYGVGDVEREGEGKKVVAARVRLEERHGPTPARRVVSIETRDGAIYRFQRYSRDEPLAFFERKNADGEAFAKQMPLPEHVDAVREAIVDDEVLPDFEALLRAEVQVGDRDDGDDGDGDVRSRWTPPRHEIERRAEADLRSGVATDGGRER